MKHKLALSLAAVSVILLTGCAASVSTIEPDLSAYSARSDVAAAKTAFIRTVNDRRVFSANASSPDQPTWSNDGTKEEARAIGRKRHGYGMAMGGLVLPQGMTAAGVVKKTLTQALIENGYKVVESEAEVTPGTYVIDVEMNKFWSWMNPGLLGFTLSANVGADVADKNARTVHIEGRYSEGGFQTFMDSNWLKVLNQALKNFFEDAKAKLK